MCSQHALSTSAMLVLLSTVAALSGKQAISAQALAVTDQVMQNVKVKWQRGLDEAAKVMHSILARPFALGNIRLTAIDPDVVVHIHVLVLTPARHDCAHLDCVGCVPGPLLYISFCWAVS